jgi:6-phosphofructokinase 1
LKKKNVFYAQSGGVTAVINASACGVIETARKHKSKLGRVYAGRNGILGALTEDMIDTTAESARTIAALKHTPGGAFGSARYKLKGFDKNRAEYERLIEVFKAHDIGYFFYNGGGDSMDTAHKVSQIGAELGFPVVCIGVPKTVDNDLPVTDTCPGRSRPRSTSRRWRARRRECSCSRSWAGTPGGLRRQAASPAKGRPTLRT